MVLTEAPRRLDIIILLSALGRGGAQRQAVVTGLGLQRLGHNVTFVSLRGPAALDAEVVDGGGTLRLLGSNRRMGGLLGRLRLLVDPATGRADVIYSYMPAANVTATLVTLIRRRPANVWGLRDSGLVMANYGRATRLLDRAARRLARRPRSIVCNSNAAVEHYGSLGYPRDRMVVIPNGIDVDRFTPDFAIRERTRQSFGFQPDDFVVVCLARFDPMKGQTDLIRAFADLVASHPEARLLLCGDHGEADARTAQDLAEELGVRDQVTLHQGSPRPEDVLRASDVLAMPSRYGEGFPNVVAEALACGLPVVVSDVGDAGRIAGAFGHVVSPGDPAALTEALTAAIERPGDLGTPGERRRYVCERYSVPVLVETTSSQLVAAVK